MEMKTDLQVYPRKKRKEKGLLYLRLTLSRWSGSLNLWGGGEVKLGAIQYRQVYTATILITRYLRKSIWELD